MKKQKNPQKFKDTVKKSAMIQFKENCFSKKKTNKYQPLFDNIDKLKPKDLMKSPKIKGNLNFKKVSSKVSETPKRNLISILSPNSKQFADLKNLKNKH